MSRSNNTFKSLYLFGVGVFFISVFLLSSIFGTIFKSCRSNNVVNVNVNEPKKKDTVYFQIPKYIDRVDTVKIKEYFKPKQTNKPDTTK